MSESNTKRHRLMIVAALGLLVIAGSLYLVAVTFRTTPVPAAVPTGHPTPTEVAKTQEIVKTCAVVEVRSIAVATEVERKASLDDRPVDVQIVPEQVSTTTAGVAEKAVTVIALGPVLGSMDSPTVKTDVACTANGFVLTATTTRSANYNGSVAQNVLWRPRITVAFVFRQPDVVVQTTWRMRLTTGEELAHAQTPPYADQKYPITVTKAIR